MPFRLAHHLMTWDGWNQRRGAPRDWAAALREIAGAGYAGVELSGDPQDFGPPAALARRLAGLGLEAAAYTVQVTANPWPPNTAEYRAQMDYAAELGVRTVSVCGGFLPEPRRTAFDSDYALFADNLRAAAEYARARGQTLAFHPHTGCLVETGEELDRLDRFAGRLDLCVDTGHLAAVRVDPARFVAARPGRTAHVHLKDWDPDGRTFVEPGARPAGLDFAAFLAALRQGGYEGWLVVERDDPPVPPVESARRSRAHLAPLLGRGGGSQRT